MRFLFITWFREKIKNIPKMYNYVAYRIVEFNEHSGYYGIQCVNTSIVIYLHKYELMSNIYILERLHPIQTCYLGLMYNDHQMLNLEKLSLKSRYGKYILYGQTRNFDICLIDKNKNSLMTIPCDLLIDLSILNELDSIQSLYIGIMMGRSFRKDMYNV